MKSKKKSSSIIIISLVFKTKVNIFKNTKLVFLRFYDVIYCLPFSKDKVFTNGNNRRI